MNTLDMTYSLETTWSVQPLVFYIFCKCRKCIFCQYTMSGRTHAFYIERNKQQNIFQCTIYLSVYSSLSKQMVFSQEKGAGSISQRVQPEVKQKWYHVIHKELLLRHLATKSPLTFLCRSGNALRMARMASASPSPVDSRSLIPATEGEND